MKTILTVVLGLTVSNVFMTFAWYGHLKNMKAYPWIIAGLCMVGAVYFMFKT
jgi:uncharacterized protein (DUF486 family)